MIYQFYIELLESDPLVWRRIVIPADYTFYQLHKAIPATAYLTASEGRRRMAWVFRIMQKKQLMPFMVQQ